MACWWEWLSGNQNMLSGENSNDGGMTCGWKWMYVSKTGLGRQVGSTHRGVEKC